MYLTVISGILLSFAYPTFNLEFLAWFAFVPLFFAIRNASVGKAFLLAYLAGIIFWAGTIYWLIHVTLLGLVLLVLYLSLYFGLFGLFFRLLTIDNRLSTIIIPAIWILLEYLRSHLFTGFGWVLLGYSQYLNLPVIQIADITGVWGVSFLVMMVNVVIWQLLERVKAYGLRIKDFVLPILSLTIVLSYGFYKLNLTPYPLSLTPLKISIIQGNIPQNQKWDENFRESIMRRYETLTKAAAKDKPDLIIWPETSVPGVIGEEPELLARVLKLAKQVKAPLLIGAISSGAISYKLSAISYYNSAILISPEGKIIGQYDKLRLVPFGEFVPLENHFPFLRGIIGVPIGDFTAGKEYTVFKLKTQNSKLEAGFGVLICFEDIFPELSKRFVKKGAQFLVNITNDAWFMKSSAPYQHVQASVFRAVENRVPVVRAANTGLSCFIDQTGRIYDKVEVDKKDIFVIGYKTQITQIRPFLKEE